MKGHCGHRGELLLVRHPSIENPVLQRAQQIDKEKNP